MRQGTNPALVAVMTVLGIVVGSAGTCLILHSYWKRAAEDMAPPALQFERVPAPDMSDDRMPLIDPVPDLATEPAREAFTPAGTLEENLVAARRFLEAGDWSLAVSAVTAIADFGEIAFEPLKQLLAETDNATVTKAIVATIAAVESYATVETLLSIVEDEMLAHAHAVALFVLERSSDDRVIPALIRFTRTASELGAVGPHLVRTLAHLGGPDVAEFFAEILRKTELEPAAEFVVRNLGELAETEKIVPQLFDILSTTDFTGRDLTATAVARGTASIRDTRVPAGLAQIAGQEGVPEENRIAAAEAAVLTGDSSAIQAVMRLARFSTEPAVRCGSIGALRAIGADEQKTADLRVVVEQVLLDLLRDPDEWVRANACFSLAGIGGVSSVALLEQRAALDGSAIVQREAKRALNAIRKRERQQKLRKPD
ncbi:MAG: HEAT repeat domain-containing protein [Planctomycetota bacterium]|nr:HEAT repeat domain-containing protein [Planctomycetota bacterium]